MQIQIALRGLHLLCVGGRMVYSTCTFNPIENEAVVAQLLTRTNGAVRIVDARATLPGLKCDPGMTTWTVVGLTGEVANAPGDQKMHEACFPPAPDVAKQMRLDKCMRFLPHHCNGGGFFVCVLEKVKPWVQPPIPVKEAKEDDDGTAAPGAEPKPDAAASNNKKQAGGKKGRKADDGAAETVEAAGGEVDEEKKKGKKKGPSVPPTFVATPEVVRDSMRTLFGLGSFPWDNVFVRLPTGETTFRQTLSSNGCLVSNDVRDIIAANERLASPGASGPDAPPPQPAKGFAKAQQRLLIVSVGLRCVATEHITGGWRLAHEATPLFAHTIAEGHPRVLRVTAADILPLLDTSLRDQEFKNIHNEALSAQLQALEVGAVVLKIACRTAPEGYVACAALRARTRWQLLVDKDDLGELACRLGMADHPLVAKVMSAQAGDE